MVIAGEEMSNQMFQKGDLVRVTKDMPSHMSHFTSDIDAIVIGSYADQYGGSDTKDYTLHLRGGGECSWYEENQLSLIERDRSDLLSVWQKEQDDEIAQKSNLDWIFENGPEVAESPHGASLQTLADSLGLGSLWGDRGEGITYYTRSMQILGIAIPYLQAKDKVGWLKLTTAQREP